MTPDELFQLEIQVAKQVMGWNVFEIEECLHDGNTARPHCLICPVPDGTKALKVFDVNGNIRWWLPSRNIADAWEVIEKMHAITPWRLNLWWSDEKKVWKCECGRCRHFTAPTASEAICLAALEVVNKEQP